MSIATPDYCIEQFVPAELLSLADPQTAIPAIGRVWQRGYIVGRMSIF
jgi:hypothetical protein